ncbi:ATP-binding protein [Pseudomonas solani]|uniref:ATP-binding protein n=1 Tax=Pseudomonas solani TaxID=2731552 RepID=UPI003C2C45B2
MKESRFSPAPRTAGHRLVNCQVEGHGQYEQHLIEQFDGSWKKSLCPQCEWNALHNTPKDSDSFKEAEANYLDRELSASLIATGITPRFRRCSFDSFSTDGEVAKERALRACRSYAEKFSEHYEHGRALMLLGEIGNGKTHLACAVLQHVVRKEGASGLIVTAEAITQAVSDSFRSNASPSKAELLRELAEVDLLVIDEVGMHTPRPGKDFTPSLLHEVIDRRYQLVLPTVLISNQTREKLPDFIGPRAIDRLRENGGLMAPFTWQSARVGSAA